MIICCHHVLTAQQKAGTQFLSAQWRNNKFNSNNSFGKTVVGGFEGLLVTWWQLLQRRGLRAGVKWRKMTKMHTGSTVQEGSQQGRQKSACVVLLVQLKQWDKARFRKYAYICTAVQCQVGCLQGWVLCGSFHSLWLWKTWTLIYNRVLLLLLFKMHNRSGEITGKVLVLIFLITYI